MTPLDMFDQSNCLRPSLIHLSFVEGTQCSGEEVCNLSVYLLGHALLRLTLLVLCVKLALASIVQHFTSICHCVNVNILLGSC